jgi:hypothetical protein
MHHTEERLSFTPINGDIDGELSIAMVREGTSVRKIIDRLGLDLDFRLTKGVERSGYKGSGQWSIDRDDEDKQIVIRVDVGCWCEHDCCGHMCGLSYRLGKLAGNVSIVRSCSYNY